MDRFVKLKDLKGFDDEFLNALGELEQRIFESYNRFMPAKDGEVEHRMFTEYRPHYTTTARQIVEKRYKKDLEKLDYDF